MLFAFLIEVRNAITDRGSDIDMVASDLIATQVVIATVARFLA